MCRVIVPTTIVVLVCVYVCVCACAPTLCVCSCVHTHTQLLDKPNTKGQNRIHIQLSRTNFDWNTTGICFWTLAFLHLYQRLDICNFADDTAIYAWDRSIEAVISRLVSELHRMLQWFTDTGMKANPSKFQIMFLGQEDMSKLCLNINGLLIPSRKQVKLLG